MSRTAGAAVIRDRGFGDDVIPSFLLSGALADHKQGCWETEQQDAGAENPPCCAPSDPLDQEHDYGGKENSREDQADRANAER
jgi:hypothetical protein